MLLNVQKSGPSAKAIQKKNLKEATELYLEEFPIFSGQG